MMFGIYSKILQDRKLLRVREGAERGECSGADTGSGGQGYSSTQCRGSAGGELPSCPPLLPWAC